MPIQVWQPHQNLPFTEEQLRAIIRRYDVNGDGRLDKQELKQLFKSLGAVSPGLRANLALRHASNSGDGVILRKKMEKKMKEPAKYAMKLGTKLNDDSVVLSREELKEELKDLRLTKEAFEYLSLYIPGYRARCGLSYDDVNGDGYDKEEELGNVIKCAVKFGYRFKDRDFIKIEQKEADSDRDECFSSGEMDDLVHYIMKLGYTIK